MGKYIVYILKSEVDGSFYVGYTSDIQRRVEQHNSGRSSYTSRKIPWKLVYTEVFEHKSDALKREKFLKAQKSTEFYKKLISEYDK